MLSYLFFLVPFLWFTKVLKKCTVISFKMLLEMFPLIYSFFYIQYIYYIYFVLKFKKSMFIVISPLGCTCSQEIR